MEDIGSGISCIAVKYNSLRPVRSDARKLRLITIENETLVISGFVMVTIVEPLCKTCVELKILYRTSIFETPFGLLIRLLQSHTFITTITDNHFLRCYTFTQLTILHANIPFYLSQSS
jgi:hypothetical protein